jgi:hypothetical protein
MHRRRSAWHGRIAGESPTNAIAHRDRVSSISGLPRPQACLEEYDDVRNEAASLPGDCARLTILPRGVEVRSPLGGLCASARWNLAQAALLDLLTAACRDAGFVTLPVFSATAT